MDCIKFDQKNKGALFTKAPIPTVEHNEEVVVKVVIAGICGTDIHILQVSALVYLAGWKKRKFFLKFWFGAKR